MMGSVFRYRIFAEWNETDGVYVARIPAFPGLAAHGDTPEEATREAREAALGMLEVLAEDGHEPPQPDARGAFSGQIRLRIPPSLHEMISREAEAEGVSMNQEIIALLSQQMGLRKASERQRKHGK